MAAVGGTTELYRMLGNAFDKVDGNKSQGLDVQEFQSFFEVLKPGLPVDKDCKTTVSANETFKRFDADSDGVVSKDEMNATPVLMPAELTDDSLMAMIEYLKAKPVEDVEAFKTAGLLSSDDEAEKPKAA